MIFIPGNVPSVKNSRQIVMIKKRKLLLHSKTVTKYLQKIGIKHYSAKGGIKGYKTKPNLFKIAVGDYFKGCPEQIVLGFHFVRDSHRKFDYINAMQIICDLLVAHKYIVDDDCDHLVPACFAIKNKYYSYNKNNPGVWLKIKI